MILRMISYLKRIQKRETQNSKKTGMIDNIDKKILAHTGRIIGKIEKTAMKTHSGTMKPREILLSIVIPRRPVDIFILPGKLYTIKVVYHLLRRLPVSSLARLPCFLDLLTNFELRKWLFTK